MSEAEVFWGLLISALWLALGVGGLGVEWVLARCEQ